MMKEIKENQQAAQGINIGTQGNQGGVMPEGAKGPADGPNKNREHIPNQERSSASSKQKEKK